MAVRSNSAVAVGTLGNFMLVTLVGFLFVCLFVFFIQGTAQLILKNHFCANGIFFDWRGL